MAHVLIKVLLSIEWKTLELSTAGSIYCGKTCFLTCLLLPFPVLLKFRTDKGRDPSSDTFGEDSELLLQIRNDVLDSLGVNPDLLPEDFVRLVSVFVAL